MRYRFKTEEEFLHEYGNEWRSQVRLGWVDDMDIYLGKPLEELGITSTDIERFNGYEGYAFEDYSFSIEMIKEIDSEPINFKEYRVLDTEEMIAKFGIQWINRVPYGFPQCMNIILGKPISQFHPRVIQDNKFSIQIPGMNLPYCISIQILTKIKPKRIKLTKTLILKNAGYNYLETRTSFLGKPVKIYKQERLDLILVEPHTIKQTIEAIKIQKTGARNYNQV